MGDKINYNSIENQHILGQLVNREVYHNLCLTMQYVMEHPDSEPYNDAMEMCTEVPAEDLCQEEGWVETEDGDIVLPIETFKTAEEAAKYVGWDTQKDGLLWHEDLVYCADSWEEACAEELSDGSRAVQMDEDRWVVTTDTVYDDWEECAEDQGYERYREIYEWWAVSSWFGKKLADRGEAVADVLDFTVWGRCTTGQAILLDYVVGTIGEEMEILEGQKYSWAKDK